MSNATIDGIARADAGADPVWKAAALDIIEKSASRQKYLDTDEVFAELDRRGLDTPERRAMGPVMIKARKAGWIDLQTCNSCGTTKVIKQSVREESHGKDTAVYKSLIFKG